MTKEQMSIAALEAHTLLAMRNQAQADALYLDWIGYRSEGAFFALQNACLSATQVNLLAQWADRAGDVLRPTVMRTKPADV